MIKLAQALLFVLVVNLACWMVTEGNFIANPGFTKPIDFEQKAEDVKSQAESMSSSSFSNMVSLVTGYVVPAFNWLTNFLWYLIAGFPTVLFMLHIPSLVSVPLTMIWFTVFIIAAIEFISGRSL